MKSFLRSTCIVLTVFSLVVVFASAFVVPALAQAETPEQPGVSAETSNDGGLDGLIARAGSLFGFGALIALLVNIGKSFGLVRDGQAQNWSAGLNLLLLAGLLALRVYSPSYDIQALDSQVSGLVQIASLAMAWALQMFGSKATHSLARGIPLVGKSYSQ